MTCVEDWRGDEVRSRLCVRDHATTKRMGLFSPTSDSFFPILVSTLVAFIVQQLEAKHTNVPHQVRSRKVLRVEVGWVQLTIYLAELYSAFLEDLLDPKLGCLKVSHPLAIATSLAVADARCAVGVDLEAMRHVHL